MAPQHIPAGPALNFNDFLNWPFPFCVWACVIGKLCQHYWVRMFRISTPSHPSFPGSLDRVVGGDRGQQAGACHLVGEGCSGLTCDCSRVLASGDSCQLLAQNLLDKA